MELDPDQARVVALPDEADAIVDAAAGTGKTTTLVEVVAERVLGRGAPAETVLAIAPTRRASAELRDRIAARVPLVRQGPPARSAASLAHRIVSEAAIAAGDPPPGYLSGADHDRLIAGVLEEQLAHPASADWPVPEAARRLPAFRTELRELIARVLERGAGADELERAGRARGRAAWVAVAAVMRGLDARLRRDYPQQVPLDAASAAHRAAALVRDGHPIGERLLVVDDAHELGLGSLALLSAFRERGTRVIAFGDPDLTTGGFRGAVPAGYRGPALWGGGSGRPEPVRLALGTVHRHGAALRELVTRATGVRGDGVPALGIRGATGYGPQRAAASRPGLPPGEVRAVLVPEPHDVAPWIARRLRERLAAGTRPRDLAVVARGTAGAVRLAAELRGLGVAAQAAGVVETGREDWTVRGLLDLAAAAIAAVEASGEDGPVVRLEPAEAQALLTGGVGRLDALAVRRLRTALRRDAVEADPEDTRQGGVLVAEALAAPGALAALAARPDLRLDLRRAVRGARRTQAALHAAVAALESGATVEDLLWAIWSASGLEEHLARAAAGSGAAADAANRHLDAVVALFKAAHREVERDPTAPAARFVAARRAAAVDEDTIADRAQADGVAVGTPAQFVGEEFEAVVVADLEDGVWPDLRVRGSTLAAGEAVDVLDGLDPDTVDRRNAVAHDELRLFAAAVSRAREAVYAVAVDGDERSPSPFFSLFPHRERLDAESALAPLTLRGLVGRLRRELSRGDERAAAALAELAAAGAPGAHPDTWYGLRRPSTSAPLVDDGQPVEVHPSALGVYRECPLHWALRRLGGATTSTAAGLGTLVHDAAHRIAGSEEPAEAADILRLIEGGWAVLDFEAPWIELRERARSEAIAQALADYERRLRAGGGGTLVSETAFSLEAGRARLTGRIDRVERFVDEAGEHAIVVDFKTGRESANSSPAQLEANPQLAAYQLGLIARAIDGLPDDAPTPAGARLIVLSAQPGKTVREQAPLSAEQVEAWRERIATAAEGMAGASFIAVVDQHCHGHGTTSLCPIHVVEAVSR